MSFTGVAYRLHYSVRGKNNFLSNFLVSEQNEEFIGCTNVCIYLFFISVFWLIKLLKNFRSTVSLTGRDIITKYFSEIYYVLR